MTFLQLLNNEGLETLININHIVKIDRISEMDSFNQERDEHVDIWIKDFDSAIRFEYDIVDIEDMLRGNIRPGVHVGNRRRSQKNTRGT